MTKRLGPIMQIAYVVEDLDEAVAHWAGVLGTGPFFVLRHMEYQANEYRGENCTADVSLAFAYSGDMNIELIQQHNDAPSVFRDFIEKHGFGQQHVAVMSDDLEADHRWLGEQGIALVQRLVNGNGTQTMFFETALHGGAMLELIERSPATDAAFAYMKQAAADWDGKSPVAAIPQQV